MSKNWKNFKKRKKKTKYNNKKNINIYKQKTT